MPKKTASKKSTKSTTVKKTGKTAVKKAAKKTTTTAKPQEMKTMKSAKSANYQFGQFETMSKDTMKQLDEFSSFGKETMEAAYKSSTVFAKGMENVMKTWMSWAQNSAEKAQDAGKKLMSCKTLNELAEAQSRLAQEQFDDFVSNATKLSELSVQVANDAMEPLNSKVNDALAKAGKTMAA